ncbi:3-keto-disaccharide hydrolase [Fodinibius sediminis]|uniref:3-keto-alpha-glucoside-1,2-lyase/3-keto-2-hydroxy-glucal hydratase domain-containing protein n=1 Tax=Fodinibius sediminis TaxID=1214077 RepID=A0A521DIP0_9BACT|nr:DUF1080 domain-containing protein [Fodinibius sediminis]SMO71587.1 protein of unknown function [Fodinibius sediminis]
MKYFLMICSFLLLSIPAKAQEFKPLFNGEDLSGWTEHGTERWYVEDGELICESGPDKEYGYLRTNETYKDFILTLDFKQESNGNSGVFIRSNLEGTKISGWQVEVAPMGSHTGGIYESYGRGWLIQPSPEDEKALKPDDWNHMKIRVEGDEVTSWLNGTQMVHLEDEKIGEGTGSIALQIHSATPGNEVKVRWKNLRIHVLD